MKKNIILLRTLILLLVMALLTACSGPSQPSGGTQQPSKSEDPGEKTPTQKGPTELVYYSAGKLENEVTEIVKEFEKANNVKITGVCTTSEEFVQVVMVAINGGQQIDVMDINGQDARAFATKGLIQPLTDKVTYWDRFHEASIKQYTFGDEIYGVPTGDAGGMVMYYNPSLFKKYDVKVPTNMQELAEAKEKFAEHGIAMFAHCGGTIYMWPSWYFMLFAQTSGGKPVERTIEILEGKAKFTDADSLEAMKILEKLGTEGYFQPGVNAADRIAGEQVFIKEQTAMTYAGSWQLEGFRSGGMDEEKLDITVDLQFVDGAQVRNTGSVGSHALTLYSKIKPENTDLALKLIDYLSSDEIIEYWYWGDYREEKSAPRALANKNAKVPEEVLMDPVFQKYAEKSTPVTDTWLDWYWPPEVTKAFQEQIQMVVGGQTSAEEAMAYIQSVLDELYAEGYDFHAVSAD
ncbi:MAG TPA: extracellular solute-binding protein [Clostridiales bacterium]|nr:extracellular solute-binding protein [Clostridiales bacterium]